MQIANLRPKQALEIQLIIEESEERFSEEEIDELVELICKILK
jgi:DNA-directed RNA polymerase subunit F